MVGRIISNRGKYQALPEGTTDSLNKLLSIGTRYFLLSVRRTSNNILVVHHEDSLASKKIATMTYQDCKLAFRRKTKKDLLTLQTALEVINQKSNTIVFIDIRDSNCERQAINTAKKIVGVKRFVIVSSNREYLKSAAFVDHTIKTGYIIRSLSQLATFATFKQDVALTYILPNEQFYAGVTKRAFKNILVVPWMVNDVKRMNVLLKDARVYGVITDKPELFTKHNSR